MLYLYPITSYFPLPGLLSLRLIKILRILFQNKIARPILKNGLFLWWFPLEWDDKTALSLLLFQTKCCSNYYFFPVFHIKLNGIFVPISGWTEAWFLFIRLLCCKMSKDSWNLMGILEKVAAYFQKNTAELVNLPFGACCAWMRNTKWGRKNVCDCLRACVHTCMCSGREWVKHHHHQDMANIPKNVSVRSRIAIYVLLSSHYL